MDEYTESLMKIAIVGGTGFVGSKLVSEALRRGHEVTAIARHPEKLPVHEKLNSLKLDLHDTESLAAAISGHDVVISSVTFHTVDGKALLDAVKKSGVSRFLVVGGAGSLYLAPGIQLIDTPQFPAELFKKSDASRKFLDVLKNETELNWVLLSPQTMLVPGERTGKFRIGTDYPLFNEEGKSIISVEDLAFAMLDEVEKPMFSRQRFTVGY
jgi:putative NADH-flavin reductase